eukprot:CAMPEP_0194484604 /NCGR_PEP_ID=MMETSP0253-20130528/5888_1 /TAXON_ID=2966 /ORGANISM="Noctiluca scintillans" /LENGTH=62 /DNA_ID=CAMNT_0039324441 /DNA_START=30 /DNA_END=215 /DNA_ORIENTATION=+
MTDSLFKVLHMVDQVRSQCFPQPSAEVPAAGLRADDSEEKEAEVRNNQTATLQSQAEDMPLG